MTVRGLRQCCIRIIPKLLSEHDAYVGVGSAPANAKRGTVDVHRSGALFSILSINEITSNYLLLDNYQFAFFFRYAEPHAVVIKVSSGLQILVHHHILNAC